MPRHGWPTLCCNAGMQARAEERHGAAQRRAEALAAQLVAQQGSGSPAGASPDASPAKTAWRVGSSTHSRAGGRGGTDLVSSPSVGVHLTPTELPEA